MTKMQEHILTLLREIDCVCTEKKLPYVLFGPSAAYVMQNEGTFGEEVSLLQIMMTGRDAVQLAGLLMEQARESGAPRAVESLETNPYLSQNMIRYVDTSTTRISLRTMGAVSCPGAAVEIIPMFTGKVGKDVLFLEEGLLYLNGGYELNPVQYRRRVQLCIQAALCARALPHGAERAARRVYAAACGGAQGVRAEGKGYVRWGGEAMKRVNASFLKDTVRIPLEDLLLPVPSDWDAFARILEPAGWAAKLPGYLAQLSDPDLITDADQPYAQTLLELKKAGIDPDELAGESRECVKDSLARCMSKEKPVQDVWLSAKRSVDRIDLFCALLPRRRELRGAAQAGDLKRVEEILRPYLEAADLYLYRGLGLYLDREIFDYAARVWKKKGNRTKAARVWLLTPASHRRKNLYRELRPLLCARGKDAGPNQMNGG